MDFEYKIIRSKRKTIALTISKSCEVIVRAPNRTSKKYIEDFVAKHKLWIEENLKKQQEKLSNIKVLSQEKIENLKKSGVEYCLLDAPTLYESGADKKCTSVIAVLAQKEIRANRIKQRDNLTAEQLESRLNAAQPDDFYKKRAKYILYNNGILTELKEKALEILKEIKEI